MANKVSSKSAEPTNVELIDIRLMLTLVKVSVLLMVSLD